MEEKLVPHPNARSKAWRHFGFRADANGDIVDKKKIVCRLCRAVVAYSGNTNNLTYHLEKEHPEQFREIKELEEPKKDIPRSVSVRQLSLKATLTNATPYPKGSSRHKELVSATADFICHGLQPVSVVDEPSFRKLMAKADPRYAMPTRTYFSWS